MRTNRREVGIKQEAVPGTAETIAIADLLVRTRNGDTFQSLVDLFDTEEVQAASSKRPNLAGERLFDCNMSYILGSPASLSVLPVIDPLLVSAMFLSIPIEDIAIGAITGGPFEHGETITGGTSTETATVFRDTADGAATIKFRDASGPFSSGEVLTGSDSGATTTTSATANPAGRLYKPTDSDFEGASTLHHVTVKLFLDGWFLTGRGCLSNLQALFEVGKPAVFTQNMAGGKEAHGDEPLFNKTAYSEDGNPIPRFLSGSLVFDPVGGSPYSPTDIRTMTLAVENAPEPRRDAQDSNGVLFADYDKGAPTLTVDPAHVKAATKDFFQELDDGTIFKTSWQIGQTPGSIWEFFADECQYNSVELGNERSLATLPLTIRMNSTKNEEVLLYQH